MRRHATPAGRRFLRVSERHLSRGAGRLLPFFPPPSGSSILNPNAKQRAPNNIRRVHNVHVYNCAAIERSTRPPPHSMHCSRALLSNTIELPQVLPLGSHMWCLHRTRVASAICSDSRANLESAGAEASETHGTEVYHCRLAVLSRRTLLTCGELTMRVRMRTM